MALNKEQLIALARANAKASLNPSQTYSFEGENLRILERIRILFILFLKLA